MRHSARKPVKHRSTFTEKRGGSPQEGKRGTNTEKEVQGGRGAQKKVSTKKAEPTHPPYGGVCLILNGHTKTKFSKNPRRTTNNVLI